jgi:predicted nucleic acid-binding protein
LAELLSLGQACGHELVYGELLIGDRGGRKRLLQEYEQMHQASPASHLEVGELVRRRGLHGRGAGWIDFHLLASALVDRLQLWTADPRLEAIAEEFGLAYKPPRTS